MPSVIEDKKINIPLYIEDMFISQNSEATEISPAQTSLGRIGSELIYMNGNPGMGLASGTLMASLGSSLYLFTLYVFVH